MAENPQVAPATFPAWCSPFCPRSPWPPCCSLAPPEASAKDLCMGLHPLADCSDLELRIAHRSWWLQCGLSGHLTVFPLPLNCLLPWLYLPRTGPYPTFCLYTYLLVYSVCIPVYNSGSFVSVSLLVSPWDLSQSLIGI